jgi:hypothetical protein
MAQYASGTTVSVIRSIGELDKLLSKHGGTGFAYGRDDATATTRVMFRLADRMCRFEIVKPSWQDFSRTPTGLRRDQAAATRLADAEEQRRWRGLVLVVKALLVAVNDGVIDLSAAFLPYTVLPSGETVSEWAAPQLDVAYATAQMPELMPGAMPSPRLAIERP